MSMTKSYLLAGIVGVFALVSCPEDDYYDTPSGHNTRGSGSPHGPTATRPSPYGQPSPYGPATPNPYSPGYPSSPYAPGTPGVQNPNPYGPTPTPTPPPAPTPVGPTDYPVAVRTNNPDQVVSPFDPNRVISIEGYRSGQLVRDPENKKIFRVP